MAFLLCLDPLMNQHARATTSSHLQPRERQQNQTQTIENPIQECVFSEPSENDVKPNRRSSIVLHLVSHEQSKWRKQV